MVAKDSKKMKIKIIRIEEPYAAFDDLGVPLTKEQEKEVEEISRKVIIEFNNFCIPWKTIGNKS